MNDHVEGVFIGVMDWNEAKIHQVRLKDKNIYLELKSNPSTCTTGCKVTVEVWGRAEDITHLQSYFHDHFLKNVQGHVPNFDHLSEVFDSSKESVTCQACGAKFSPSKNECPDCGLVYY
jgi:hypothetical protein